MFTAFQANVVAYTVAVLAEKIGDRLDLNPIWSKQAVSHKLLEQIALWAKEVNEVLHRTASGRMISEWAKDVDNNNFPIWLVRVKDAMLGANRTVWPCHISDL